MKKITLIVPILLAMSFFVASAAQLAQNTQSGQGTFPAANDPTQVKSTKVVPISLPNPLGSTQTIPQLIDKIINFLITLASFAVLPFMIVWGAFQLMTAAEKPDRVKAAKETITYAILGYALLLISKGIILIIQEVLGKGGA